MELLNEAAEHLHKLRRDPALAEKNGECFIKVVPIHTGYSPKIIVS